MLAHRVADDDLRGAHGGDVGLGQPLGERLAAQLGQLGAGERGGERAEQADRVALVAEREPPGAVRVGHSPTRPMTGVG